MCPKFLPIMIFWSISFLRFCHQYSASFWNWHLVQVQSIHGEHDDAARAVEKRLATAKEAVKTLSEKDAAAKKALSAWDKQYKKAHGATPDDADRWVSTFHQHC